MRSSLVALLVLLGLALPAQANNYPDIDWKTVKTEHFVIHYYDDVAWTAAKVAKAAEEIYPTVTGIYDYKPRHRTHIVVRDDEDTSNGFAVFNLGYITIWASPSALRLRGRHDWVYGTLTHEFAHIVSLLAASGGGWLIEGIRVGGITNRNRRSNVHVGATAYIPTNPYSRWWAEGTAQIDTAQAGYDLWDTNQDMLLRTATLGGTLLDFHQVRNIKIREHYDGEMVYNQGYAFLLWLKETYGDDANVRIAKTAGKKWNFNFDRNIEKTIGKSAYALHQEWEVYLQKKYKAQVAEIEKAPIQGERIPLLPPKAFKEGDPTERPYKDGVSNAYARFSPDCKWFTWVERSIVNFRYLDKPCFLPNLEPSEEQPAPLRFGLSGRYYSWAPDSKRLVLSERRPNVLGGYPYYDLFVADISPVASIRKAYVDDFAKAETKKEKNRLTRNYKRKIRKLSIKPKRLTKRARNTHPAWSPDGEWIAFSQNGDGHRNLRLIRPDGSQLKDLVAIGGDSEAIDPTWSPNSKQIAFTFFHHEQSDIWLVSREGGKPRPVMLDKASDQEPVFTPDGKSLIFSSDRSGIFQLYRIDLEKDRMMAPLTRVSTGAFMPSLSRKGDQLLYLLYTPHGYKPYQLSLSQTGKGTQQSPIDENKRDQQLKTEEIPPLKDTKAYLPWPRPVRLFPTLVLDNGQFMAGIGVQVSDFLQHHSLSASGLFGEDQDYQVSYRNRMFYPDIFASYTSYVRNDPFQYLSGSGNLPQGVTRDNIQFIRAGVSQDFRSRRGLAGGHTVELSYARRFVDRRIGFPVLLNDTPTTDFRLITNDSGEVTWNYRKRALKRDRDFDINPRGATYASLGYSFVHTKLYSPDTTISSPNQNYAHHEGTLNVSKYMALPWTKPWWCHHTFWFQFTGGMKSRQVNVNDKFFLGGRLNYRAFGQISSNILFYGYEAFSISGETLLLLSTGYTVPVARMLEKKIGYFYFDALYASFFGEIGNAWDFGKTKNLQNGNVLLQDVGAELKLKAFFLNENNRWNSVLRVAYGFQDNAAHGFSGSDLPVRIYVGIGTNF